MGTSYSHITEEQADLIRNSQVFFVASVAPDLAPGPDAGPVNLSPKGSTPLHVIDANRVAYLDYTGSGKQTASHALAGGPITLMVMSMDGENAGIVRCSVTPLCPLPRIHRWANGSWRRPATALNSPSGKSSTSPSRARRRAAGTACQCSSS